MDDTSSRRRYLLQWAACVTNVLHGFCVDSTKMLGDTRIWVLSLCPLKRETNPLQC